MDDQKKELWKKGKQLIRYFSDCHIGIHAASACFFIVLAFFPMLMLFLGLMRYTGNSVDVLLELLRGVIPGALLPAAEKLIRSTYHATTGTVVSVSALTALWSASRGVYGVLMGLDAIYDIRERRGYLQARMVSTFYTFAFLVVLLLTLVLHVFGKGVLRGLSALQLPVLSFLVWLVDRRFLLLLVLQTTVFCLLYMFLPDRKNKFMESLPGALFSAVGWQLLSLLFSVYVERFNNYANIYGSVYAVALCLLWLYLCLCILFFGGTLNRLLKDG